MTDRGTVWAGALGGLIAFAALNVLAMARGVGGFEYPLDDPYIHLAMADQIARGGYGVNAGEYASAASSPLYPLLFAPFADTDIQRWLPLIWNAVAIITAGALFGWTIARAGLGTAGIALAAIAPFALNMYVTAFTGMENMLHGVASLMIVVGLWQLAENQRVTALLIAGTFLAPAFRLEGAALALAGGGAAVLMGHVRLGIALSLLAALPVALFSGFLISIGLEPLPNSVVAKLSEVSSGAAELHARIIAKFMLNLTTDAGKLLFLTTLGLLVFTLMARRAHPHRAIFGLAVAASSLAHLAVGNIGWMDRYENYILISTVAALGLLACVPTASRVALIAAVFGASAFIYLPGVQKSYQWNMRAMQLQQAQMARFAKEHARVAVAVNDLGHVVWRNPDYVLDLWGLASSDALNKRLSDPAPGWADAMVNDVPLAMIYERWLGDAVGPGWVALGALNLSIPGAFLGGDSVTFYATTPDAVADLSAKLVDWSVELPPGATFEWAE